MEFLPKLRLDMLVSDDKLETAIEAITAVAKTGKNGDGKIFVFPLFMPILLKEVKVMR